MEVYLCSDMFSLKLTFLLNIENIWHISLKLVIFPRCIATNAESPLLTEIQNDNIRIKLH